MPLARITDPDSPALAKLCEELASRAGADSLGDWPAESLALCGEAGVFEWFLSEEWGGQGWSEADTVRGYLALSQACLTTTFIITQRTGACRRIAGSQNESLKERLLPPLATGQTLATVGISHLTTSHRHFRKPVLRAIPDGGDFVLDGFSPWVTSNDRADWIVIGATIMAGEEPTDQQILAVVPTDAPGLSAEKPANLVGLSSSRTGKVELNHVPVTQDGLIAGPVENVMMTGRTSRSGGHETSTLALGLAAAAIEFLAGEAIQRQDLKPIHTALAAELADVVGDVLIIASGEAVCTNESLRQRANSLVLRATQASMAAAKGAGYVVGHPVERWCREALFFLVWSCPQPVMNANLCELAGITD